MLEPEIAALHDGAVDHLGVFVEPSLVLLRTSRIDHDVAGPQSCCSVPRPNSILPLSIQTISAHLRDGSHEGLGLRRKEFKKPGASLSCARPAAPREAHNGIDAGWSDGSRALSRLHRGFGGRTGNRTRSRARVLAHCPEGLTQWKKGQTKQRYDTDQGLTLCRKLQSKINEPLNPTPSAKFLYN